MNTAVAICHGKFGRACLYRMNSDMTKHVHREGHLTFLVDGDAGAQHICGKRHEVSYQNGCAINPWEPHDFLPERRAGALFLVVYINPIWFLEFARHGSFRLRFGRNKVEVTSAVQRSINKVVEFLLDVGAADLLDGYLYELAEECFAQTSQRVAREDPVAGLHSRGYDFRIRNSIRILSNDECELSLNEVAKASGLSRPHFYKLFREQTGITPNLFFNGLRMERAIERLTRSEASIIDVAYELGFSAPSAFTRFFSNNVGMAPSEYRRVANLVAV